MKMASARIITDDLDRLVAFYELVTGAVAERPAPVFAELVLGTCPLAIGHSQTVQLFGGDSAHAADNRSAIVEFLVDDVDALHARLRDDIGSVGGVLVNEPTTMPWGNRSLLLRDPDLNLVNCFTPVTPEAIAKFSR